MTDRMIQSYPNDKDGFMWRIDLDTWKSKVTHWMPLPQPPKEEA